MRAIARRVKKLERQHCDVTGLAPRSTAWFDFYEEKLVRLMDGEDIGNIRIPLDVIDRLIEADDREARKESFIASFPVERERA